MTGCKHGDETCDPCRWKAEYRNQVREERRNELARPLRVGIQPVTRSSGFLFYADYLRNQR